MNDNPEPETPQTAVGKRTNLFARIMRSWWFWLFIVVVLAAGAYIQFFSPWGSEFGSRSKGKNDSQRPIPVTTAAARKADIDVYLKGLGTVIPVNTVTVKSQVSGQIVRVHFKEGQIVKAGELLAEIDSRPFQVQLMQAEGQLARDEALLKNAENDLVRYKQLLAQDSIAEQQVTTQASLVKQYKGAVKTDLGQIANARLQITYSRITAPISGRIGLRQVDPGNMIQSNDANGLAVLTQLQPVTVVFSVPQDNLPTVMSRLRAGATLSVYAYTQDSKTLLAEGTLLAVDNQIDTATGTIKMKAKFDNKDNGLFANQFVNVRMKVDTLTGATLIPTAAVQRGSIGIFVYVVKPDKTITVRPVQLGPAEGENVAVSTGIVPGELVVVVGGDKLREGSKVDLGGTEGAAAPEQGKRGTRDGSRREKR